MRWREKARIQRACSVMPGGDRLYLLLQSTLGRLTPGAVGRAEHIHLMVNWLRSRRVPVMGSVFVEVGTGHKPIMPLVLALFGAKEVVTVDLHRRIRPDLIRSTLEAIGEHRELFGAALDDGDERSHFYEAIDRAMESSCRSYDILDLLGIRYLAPADARRLPLREDSVDVHFSTTTLEHIPEPDLIQIFTEAHRVLTPSGVAIHFIDLSDHFAHQDSSVNAINFLRFEEKTWQRIAGNEFGYCNRLRAPDFVRIFNESSFSISRSETVIDDRALAELGETFVPAAQFGGYSPDDLCTVKMRVLLEPKPQSRDRAQE